MRRTGLVISSVAALLVGLSACNTPGGAAASVPSAPSDLTATPGAGSALLRWTDTSSDEDAFEVEQKVGDGNFQLVESLSSNTTQLEVPLATVGEYVTYRVRSLNQAGASNYSNTTAIVVGDVGAGGGTVESGAGVTVSFDAGTLSGGTHLPVVVDETPERPYAEGVVATGPSTKFSLPWALLSNDSAGYVRLNVPRYAHVPAQDPEAVDYAAVFLNSSKSELFALTYVPYDRESGDLTVLGAELLALADSFELPELVEIIVEPLDLAGWRQGTAESSRLTPLSNTETGLYGVDVQTFSRTDAEAVCESTWQLSAEIPGLFGIPGATPPSDKPPLILVHGWQVLGNYMTFKKSHSDGNWADEAWERLLAAVAPIHGKPLYRYAPQACAWIDMIERIESTGLDQDYEIYTFAYDSDLSVVSNAARLKTAIEKFGADPQVTILAHSMGGLVANAYIHANGDERINHVVTLGTPYRGSSALACSSVAPNCGQVSLLFDSAAADVAVGALGTTSPGTLAAYSTLKTLIAAATRHPGTKNLAWDNPTLARFNDVDRDYDKYTAFYGNLAGQYDIPGGIVKALKGHDNDGIVPLESARLEVDGTARIADVHASGAVHHNELKSDRATLSDVIEVLQSVLPHPDPEPNPDPEPEPDPDPDPQEGADLIVSGLSVTPTSAQAGSTVTVSFTIVNQGEASAGASTTRIRINMDPGNVTTSDTLLEELSTPSIPGGATHAYTRNVTLPSWLPDGNYYVWVTADVFNQADQSDYENDRARSGLGVGEPSSGSYPACTSAGETVAFSDPTFELAIRDALQIYGRSFECQDLWELRTLVLSDEYASIGDLAGIEHAVNLEEFVLYGPEVRTLQPLAGLSRLEYLHLYVPAVADISPLASNSRLADLTIGAYDLRDLEPLSGLTELVYLSLESELDITDVSPLSSLTQLEVLDLQNNAITDLSPLAGLLNLDSLYLTYNQISDISPLANLRALEHLNIYANDIRDIEVLGNMTAMRTLVLGSAPLDDATPLSNLQQLEFLMLDRGGITDISFLEGLTNLREVDLRWNEIRDVTPLANLPGLWWLALEGNRVTDISPLVAASGLQQGSELLLSYNCLDSAAAQQDINTLRARGVEVTNEGDGWDCELP